MANPGKTNLPGNTGSGDRGFDRVLEHIQSGTAVADDVWCLINPRRAGCPGDPNRAPDAVVNNYSSGVPMWVYVAIILLVILVLFLYLRKK